MRSVRPTAREEGNQARRLAVFDTPPVSGDDLLIRVRFPGMPRALDTSARVAALHVELYRNAGEAERAEIMVDLSDALRDLAAAGVRQRHPDYDDDQVHEEVLAVFYGRGRRPA